VITSDDKIEKVVVKAYDQFADYLRTLPMHESQKELSSDDESTLFEYHVKPTFEFYQLLLAQGDQIEVMEPQSVREEMHNFAKNLMSFYERKEDKSCKKG
jgi:predicted DNA-binding transcriptional regulator YafY